MRHTSVYDAFLAEHFPQVERPPNLSRRRDPKTQATRRSLMRH